VVLLAGSALLAAGLLSAGGGALLLWHSGQQEQQLTNRWTSAVDAASPQTTGTGPVTPNVGGTQTEVAATHRSVISAPREGVPGAVFAIDVPKLHYFAAVQQGVSLSVLFVGPGHYPSTPMPGSEGNVGVAAHNTYWIAFGQLKTGDTVRLETLHNKYTYRVTGTRIVGPNDRTILAPSPGYHLTLTTCWPLWAGALATQRLAISAVQIST